MCLDIFAFFCDSSVTEKAIEVLDETNRISWRSDRGVPEQIQMRHQNMA